MSIMPSYSTMLLGEASGSKSSSESKQATYLSMSVTVSCMIALLNRVRGHAYVPHSSECQYGFIPLQQLLLQLNELLLFPTQRRIVDSL